MCVASVALLSNFQFSWTAFAEKNKHTGEDRLLGSDIIFWEKKGNSTPLPVVFNTSYTAKIAESMTTNPVIKTDLNKISTPLHGGEAETPMPVLYKKSFNKLPRWDFEDVYNQDAPPRHTVSML